MELQSLKNLIKGANKRIADIGDSLLEKAEANGRIGKAEAVIELLESHQELFDDSFKRDLPGLSQHLGTRSADNLKMLEEVLSDRLGYLAGLNQPKVIEDEVPEPEEDFASLLTQKSVDEMSDDEMKSINIDKGEMEEELPVVEEAIVASDEIGLDDFIKRAEVERSDVASESDDQEEHSEEDLAALLEQRSVDEMDFDELDAITVVEKQDEDEPSMEEALADQVTELDEEPRLETEEAMEDFSDESELVDAKEDLDSFENEESDDESVLDDEEATGVQDELDQEVASEEVAQDIENLMEDQIAEGLEDVMGEDLKGGSELEHDTKLELENNFDAIPDDLDGFVDDLVEEVSGAAEQEEPMNEDRDTNQDLDSLLDGLDAADSPQAVEQNDSGEEEQGMDDFDTLMNESDDSASDEDDGPTVREGLDDLIEDLAPVAEKVPNIDDMLNTLSGEVEAEDDFEEKTSSDDLLGAMQESDDDSELDDLLNSDLNNEESITFVDDEDEKSDGLTELLEDELESDRNHEDSLTKLLESDDDRTSVQGLTGALEESEATDTDLASVDMEVEEILADVGAELSEDPSITEVLNILDSGDDEENSLDEEDEETESLSNLLSEVTGRQMSENDLEHHEKGETMSLDQLVESAEESLSESEETVRITYEGFLLESDDEILYEGSDEVELKNIIASVIFNGEHKGLRLLKKCRKEIVRVIHEEIPVNIKIQSS